jgi:hypothetical protein
VVEHDDEVTAELPPEPRRAIQRPPPGEVRTPDGSRRTWELAESVLAARNGGETKSRTLTPEEVAEFGAPVGAPNP